MNLNEAEANALTVTMLAKLRDLLFESTDYSIIELCDTMLLIIEDGDPDEDNIDATPYALYTGLRMIYATIEEYRPDHFKSDIWRYNISQMVG